MLSVVSFSCKTKSKSDTSIEKTDIRQDIPLTKKGQPDYFYKLYSYQASQLKLDSLEVGYDSLQIRIWYNYGLLDVQNVVVIKKNSERWSADLLTFQYDENDSSYMRRPILKEKISKLPALGWSSFIKELIEFNIMKLPDQSKVAGYKDILGADGVNYSIEVATKEEYRFYSYWQPDVYKTEFKEAMSMALILEFLEKELSFKKLK